MIQAIQKIDLNCDMGEAFGNYIMPQDNLLMDHISSVNIACGFHAGDPHIMQETVNKALKKGLAIGAHPGLPDLQGFGRREMQVSPTEVYQLTIYQIGALYGFIKAAGAKLHHVKPHGALYNMAAKNQQLAQAVARAVYDFDANLYLYGLAGSALIYAANDIGLKAVSEVFADRTYLPDGSLTPRAHENALINTEKQAVEQVLNMIKRREVATLDKKMIPIHAETICIHGDNEQALTFVKAIKSSLIAEGVVIQPPL